MNEAGNSEQIDTLENLM
jgi:hypothetical protein